MRRPCPDRKPFSLLMIAGVLSCGLLASETWAAVSAGQLQDRVARLVTDIRLAQKADGAFIGRRGTQWPVGQTALAVIALHAAGVRADDPAIVKAVEYLATKKVGARQGVYEKSLKTLALQTVDPVRYLPQIADGASFLVQAQQDGGGWSYGVSGRTDYSNTQFALLGLHAAALSGVPVPEQVWRQARGYLLGGQNPDGGWGYTPRSTPSYGSMTAAGVASLDICNQWLHIKTGRCGLHPDERALSAGLSWLSRNFSVTRNPRKDRWKYYYLYALERVGVILARRYLGVHDWYREGVEHIVGEPDKVVFTTSNLEWPLIQKCFLVLFLAKGNAPILIHKAEWGVGWNRNQYDIQFLVRYIGRELGQPMDWQIIPLQAPLDQLMAAPILYVSGQGAMGLPMAGKQRLKAYTDAGGVVLAEAAEGSRAFDAVFRRTVAELYPGEELVPLPKDHPIYTAYFDIPLAARPPLEAVKGPCWISILYAPRGLSCPWDIAQYGHVNFQLGTNIAAYVTGMQKLDGKLVQPEFYVPVDRQAAPRRGAFTVGQVVHGGDWRPHKVAWAKVLEQLHQKAGLQAYSRALPISLDAESPFQAQMLYLTGVQDVALSREAKQKLRDYLARGGFLFAEAACGSERFDRSFRKLVAELFPDEELRVLPVGHELYEAGEPLGAVRYSPSVRQRDPELTRPVLEFIEVDGRAVLVYSAYDLSSAIDGHPCFTCPSVLEPAASRLVTKIVLYGLSS